MRKQELHPRTAVINKSQKNQSKRARSEALIWLAANFPSAFDNSLRIRPLKTGIMDDILQYADKAAEAGISKSKLREAVVVFTRRLDYLACLKAREKRIDLNGNTVSDVSEEESEHAAAKIKKRVEKSVRNARKLVAAKSSSQPVSATHQQTNGYNKPANPVATASSEDYLPTYPVRAPAYSTQHATTQPVRTAAVVVKHKTTRQYDPDAVARLKEKLGLSRNAEEKKETAE
ncbi:ProQ/FinO family protein [Legionella bononiensis]|uniref:ProQ/FinO family protein n=1 Tax=Legionella bononiensis TaxID=2793102 RepID=A0ABS1WDW5_9GAMM|nr:ProQ/FinO family protein [Legionella bononiensis]MBL7481428.1 ProQ/FinO family protein [Legionella bononiensis]MBL7527460.1 ProQ/FinO family protein [Legionella bononiensis]